MKEEFSLILPNIRSCHNVGALFRTADACGVDKLYLCGYTATPPKPQIDKVSLGAEKWMTWEQCKDVYTCIEDLKKRRIKIIALELDKKSKEIAKLKPDFPLALIVGNEVEGLGQEILEECDQIIHIPMYGRKKSLNVSVAAGIAMYEIQKKRIKNRL